jgi:hypothetical protein
MTRDRLANESSLARRDSDDAPPIGTAVKAGSNHESFSVV